LKRFVRESEMRKNVDLVIKLQRMYKKLLVSSGFLLLAAFVFSQQVKRCGEPKTCPVAKSRCRIFK
jgi:hypothetical protein